LVGKSTTVEIEGPSAKYRVLVGLTFALGEHSPAGSECQIHSTLVASIQLFPGTCRSRCRPTRIGYAKASIATTRRVMQASWFRR